MLRYASAICRTARLSQTKSAWFTAYSPPVRATSKPEARRANPPITPGMIA